MERGRGNLMERGVGVGVAVEPGKARSKAGEKRVVRKGKARGKRRNRRLMKKKNRLDGRGGNGVVGR